MISMLLTRRGPSLRWDDGAITGGNHHPPPLDKGPQTQQRSLTLAEPIAIVSDHAAFEMKAMLVEHLSALGYDPLDLGTTSTDSVDYPDYGYRIAEAIASGRAERGIALCGSGIGISIAVNRHPACRCALVSDGLSARLARQHNDCNVLALGARLIGIETAKDCVEQFLATPFAGGRHQRRVDKLTHPIFAQDPQQEPA
jgi:ribose 5-phosphate isomerase B